MTLSPGRILGPRLTLIKDADVSVVEELGTWCYAPGCDERPEPGAHHIEPRSRTGGPKMFVLIDGVVVPNRCRLCPTHHRMVTGEIGGYRARVVYHFERTPHWCWLERDSERRPRAEVGCTCNYRDGFHQPWCPTRTAPLYSHDEGWYCVGQLRIPPRDSGGLCDGRTPAL